MFDTARLRVGTWHDVAERGGFDLVEAVADLLTEATTQGLPEAWRGDFTNERAAAWVAERDGESPTLLAVDSESGRSVGLVIVHAEPLEESLFDLRIGYVVGESFWTMGLATELVGGLVAWARRHDSVRTLTGGVAATNRASARVLVKNGFVKTEGPENEGDLYQLDVGQSEWAP